ncbi:MAG: TonB-dependent receptor [Bacteroidales bacterium]|nr:TonB-dependent receptor [Bacteroidales bacterium]
MKFRSRAYVVTILLVWLTGGQYMLSQPVLQGTVTDKESNESLIGVNVYIPELQKGTVSNQEGFYTLKDIPKGRFKIQYSYLGYETYVREINFNNGGTQTLDIQLHESAIKAQEVIVTSGRISTQHENAIKIELVKLSSLDHSGSGNLMDKLSNIPGIDVISGSKGIATPVIRGLSTTNVVLLSNGIKMENFQFSVDHPYVVDETDISCIEIIKGPASLLYGSDAIGGVLNLIKAPPAPVNTMEGSLRSEFQSNYQGVTNRLVIKGSRENIFGGFSAYQSMAKDFTTGAGRAVPNSRFSGYGFSTNGGLRSKNGLFKLSWDYGKMTPGLTLPQSINLVDENSYKNELWYQNLDNHLITLNNTLFYSRMKVNLDLSYQGNHRRLQGSDFTPAFTMVDMYLQSITWQAKTKYYVSEKSNLIFAYQGMFQSNRNGDAPEHVLPDYSIFNHSMVGLWQQNFKESTFYQFGIRFDHKSLDVPDQLKEGDGEEMLNGLGRSYNNFSLSTGMTQKLTSSVLLRGNLASAYRTPSVAELMQDGVHADTYERGNRDLRSQRNIEGDLSLHYHAETLKVEVAVFCNRIFDYIFLSPGSDTTVEGLLVYQYAQSDALLYGLESEFEWSPLSFLTLSGSYSHTIARQDDGDYLPFIPQDKLSGQAEIMIPGKGVMKKLEIVFSPVYALSQVHPHHHESETDAYFLLNGSIRIMLALKSQTMEAGLYFQNLLDTAYYDHLSTLKELGYYNLGRNVSFKLLIPFSYENKVR